MSFLKTGAIFKIAESREINFSDWTNFKKQAAKEATVKEAIEKESDLEIVASVDTENFIYIHSTIMAGIKTGNNGYWITPETEKFINDNHDAWTNDDLLKDYKSFKTATTFVEHNQDLEKARGKCVDVIARKMPDTVLIDVLFSVAKKHADLVDNIKTGIINAVSMGCSTEQTVCSICGNKAKDSNEYCKHVNANGKGQMFKCADGKSRKSAEICKNNTFFDISLVANPAFAGAVFRKILSSEQVGTQLLANLISNKIESFREGEVLLKAASKDMQVELKKDGKVNITANNNQISEMLPEQELNNIQTVLGNEKASSNLLSKIINKFFGKTAVHPIMNTSPIKDFSISYSDHKDIPYSNPHETLDDFQAQEKPEFKRVARTKMFACYNCGYKDELWQIKAASIDNGFEDVMVCPKCNFITETETFAKSAYQITTIDKLQLKDLGYGLNDIRELEPDQVKIILSKDISKDDYEKDPNVALRRAGIHHSITKSMEDDAVKLNETYEYFKGQKFIASKEIPVDNDEGVFHFDEYGSSIITKNEKLTFIGSVENGQYGLFKTELGEEVFIPVQLQKKTHVIQRPDEYHREFEGKDKSQYKRNKDVMDSTDTGEEGFKDNRNETGAPGDSSENAGQQIMGPRIVKQLVKEEFAVNG